MRLFWQLLPNCVTAQRLNTVNQLDCENYFNHFILYTAIQIFGISKFSDIVKYYLQF